MPATHKKITYKSIEVGNPFAEGQDRAYADILRDKMEETRRWRNVGLGVIFLFIVTLCLFFYAVNQQKVVPVLVNVMPSGESQYLGEVRQTGALQVPEAAILYHIRKYVTSLRTISSDYQVLYNNIDECFAMVTQGYAHVLRRTLTANSPFEMVGRIRRAVEVESVLKITDRSYQVNWSETVTEASSNQRTAKMRGVVTIILLPTTDQTIKRNPLGIYIENCEMTEL